jgi:uncharacterized membrane protein YkvI
VNKPIICTALAFAFGLLGFERLIDKVYFCFGILGIIIAVSVAKTGKKC